MVPQARKEAAMKVELILVGKTADRHFQAGIQDYTERINHYLPFKITVIPEIKNTKNLSEEQQKTKEGEEILKIVKPSFIFCSTSTARNTAAWNLPRGCRRSKTTPETLST